MAREVRVCGEWRWSADEAGRTSARAAGDLGSVRVLFCDEAGPVKAQREPRVEPAPEPCERQRKRKLQPDEEAAEALLLKMVKRELQDTPQRDAAATAETAPVQSPPVRTTEADSTMSPSTDEDNTKFLNHQEIYRTDMVKSMSWPNATVNVDLKMYQQFEARMKSKNAELIDGANPKPSKILKSSKVKSTSAKITQRDTAKVKPGQVKSGKVWKTSEAKTKSKKSQSKGTEKQPISSSSLPADLQRNETVKMEPRKAQHIGVLRVRPLHELQYAKTEETQPAVNNADSASKSSRVNSPSVDSQQSDIAKIESENAQHIGGLNIRPLTELQISKTETQNATSQAVHKADIAPADQHISPANIKPRKVQKTKEPKSKSKKSPDNGTKTSKPRKNAAKPKAKKPQDLTAYACEVCGLVVIGGNRVVAHILTTHWD